MKNVGRFIELGKIIRKVSQLLIDVENPDPVLSTASKNICKLLYYTERNPLEQPTGDPIDPERPRPEFNTIAEAKEHIMDSRILLVPRVPFQEERGAFIVLLIDSFFLTENEQFKANSLIFDVFAHHDNWLLTDNLRPFLLMEQIDTIFNNRKLSIGNVKFDTGRAIVLTEQFIGYQLVYRDVSFN